MKELQKLLSKTRQAADHYGMIAEGDRIAVGLSGGKDSSALLVALAKLSAFYSKSFSVIGITVDMGFPDTEGLLDPLVEMTRELGVPYEIEKTEIAAIVFRERQEKNPCSLCAKLRRGALVRAAQRLGANKLALGHHGNDAVETLMMSLVHEGRIGCFSPVTVYEDTGISVIRPLIYASESEVSACVRAMDLPVIESPCGENGHTEREEMKNLLRSLDRQHRGVYQRLLGALERGNVDGWREV